MKHVVQIPRDYEPLIPGYLESRRADIAALEAALVRGELEDAARVGHRLKGVSSLYGFAQISAIGDVLERAGKALDRPVIEAELARLREVLSSLSIEYVEDEDE